MSATANQKLYVEGMHCPACESLIEQKLKDKSWVKYAKASLANNTVEINAKSKIDIEELNKEFSEDGYSFHETRQRSKKTDLLKALIIAVAAVLVFYLNEKNGFLGKFSVDSTSGYLSYFIFGLAAGASSCAALTGGILLSLSKTWAKIYTNNRKPFPFVLFNVGRIASFFFFGGVLGFLGSLLGFDLTVSSFFTIVVALLMAVLGLQMLDIKWIQKYRIKPPTFITKYATNQNNFRGVATPLIIGAATFFLPCGFTIVAQTNALATGSFASSAMLLLSFALGTLPMLALISFTSVKLSSHSKYSRLFSYTAGFLVFIFAIYTIKSQLNVLGAPSLSFSAKEKEVNMATKKDEYQILEIYAKGFEYYPKYSEIESGIPTKMRLYNEGAYGCANTIAARGLFQGALRIKPGLNEIDINTDTPGIYKLTCSMGMVPPVTIVVK